MTPSVGDSHPPGRDSLLSDGSVRQLPSAMLPAEGLSVRVPVIVSMRHAHFTAAIIEQLFCDRYCLHPRGAAPPGQHFATLETVDLIGPQGRLRKDRDRIEVATQGCNRRLCFQDVLVRVGSRFSLELHLDTDDADAADVRTGDFALLTRRITEAPC
jgi:propanediol utilization protein